MRYINLLLTLTLTLITRAESLWFKLSLLCLLIYNAEKPPIDNVDTMGVRGTCKGEWQTMRMAEYVQKWTKEAGFQRISTSTT